MKNGKALRWRYVKKFKIRSEQKLSVCGSNKFQTTKCLDLYRGFFIAQKGGWGYNGGSGNLKLFNS